MTKKQATNIEVKKNNRNRIYRYIRNHETVSNPDIAYELKMSLPTVTQNTKELLERGLIREAGELKSTGGRRAKALAVEANVKQAVGLDITKNHIGLLLTNITGEILGYERISLPFEAGAGYYYSVREKLEAFLKKTGALPEHILGIGISFPGIVNLEKKMITYSHVLGVEAIPFSDVEQYFPYPCSFVNDANAGAYAEGIQSDSLERFFYLSLSNTVGGAVMNHRELEQGKNFRCGEVGHMTIVPEGKRCYCGKQGCLDAYCSAKRLSDAAEGSLERFFAELSKGREDFWKIWDSYTTYLAMAVHNIHMLLDCDIVLGGYVGNYADAHMEIIRKKVFQRNTFAEEPEFVRTCRYKADAAAFGAAMKLVEAFIEQV